MAEVSRFHRFHLPTTTFAAISAATAADDGNEYPHPFALDFDNFRSLDSDSGSDSDPNFYYSDEDGQQVNFITDLFVTRDGDITEDPNFEIRDDFNSRVFTEDVYGDFGSEFDSVLLHSESNGFDSVNGLRVMGIGSDSGSGKNGDFGSEFESNGFDRENGLRVVGIGSDSDSGHNGDFGCEFQSNGFDRGNGLRVVGIGSEPDSEEMELYSGQNGDFGCEFQSNGFDRGNELRVVGIGSEADSEEMELNSGQNGDFGCEFELNGFDRGDGLRVVGVGSETDSEEMELNSGQNGDLGVNGFWNCLRIDDHEDSEWEEVNERGEDRDYLSSVIDGIEEISVSSDISSNLNEGVDEPVRNLEWEVLLAVNSIERSLEFDGNDHEYDALFGQLLESEGTSKGSPPASKTVLENLPLVDLNNEENKTPCAVCKDEIFVTEKVTKLPCSHYYHCECIVPWLNIRNTCPVCRHELPTDDSEYERRKNGRPNDFQVRYNFEIVP